MKKEIHCYFLFSSYMPGTSLMRKEDPLYFCLFYKDQENLGYENKLHK